MKDISVLAIDIGGTKISGAIFNSSRHILSWKSALIIRHQAAKWAPPINIKQAQLVSELGCEAGTYGAGYLVKEPLN